MSNDFGLSIGSQANPGFTIKVVCGCRLVFGPVPLSEFGMLIHGFSKNALVAADIADRIGASMVIGEPENLEELRKLDLPVSDKRHAHSQAASQRGHHKAAAWLREGERGESSNALCARLFELPGVGGKQHPYDPDDLRRCIQFLDETDAHGRVRLMADVSPEWAALVNHWDSLVATFREEMAVGKTAPKTYALMKEILGG